LLHLGVGRGVPPTSRQNRQLLYRAGNWKSIRKWRPSFPDFFGDVAHCASAS
jgi:hypothetical protein